MSDLWKFIQPEYYLGGRAVDAIGNMAAPYQDPATGVMDMSGTYGMGGMDQGSDFQPAPNPPMEPSPMEEIMAAGELAKRGMMDEAKQLYDRAMWRLQRTAEKPMVQEGVGLAKDLAGRGAAAAEGAYDAVTGQFR